MSDAAAMMHPTTPNPSDNCGFDVLWKVLSKLRDRDDSDFNPGKLWAGDTIDRFVHDFCSQLC